MGWTGAQVLLLVGRRYRRGGERRRGSLWPITGVDRCASKAMAWMVGCCCCGALALARADLVVAHAEELAGRRDMADLEEVAHDYLARTGRRMRVATKYLAQTRGFFARHGIADYRIAESGGATEGAPAAGSAELVVDITTTGATLAANGLKVLRDGLILKSQAQLAASLRAAWDAEALAQAERLLRIVEARAAALKSATLAWPLRGDAAEAKVVDALVAGGATRRPSGLLVDSAQVANASLALSAAGLGPVTASTPDFVFDVAARRSKRSKARVILTRPSKDGVKIVSARDFVIAPCPMRGPAPLTRAENCRFVIWRET
jgi:ATP phosphoribosyltransferase